jgi:hypothetical protein
LYGEVCLLGDFNVDQLDPGHFFPRLLDFLEMFMLSNVAIFPARGASCKFLDLFLVFNPNDVCDFQPIDVSWMIFLSCCFERWRVATLYKNIRSFRDIGRDRLLGAAASGLEFSLVYGWSMEAGYICACASDQGHRRGQIMQCSKLV